MNYGKAIRMVRAARHLSKQELAALAHVDPSYISLLETNKRKPSDDAMRALAAALEVPERLLALLAAEESDLKGISETDAAALGRQLLMLQVSTRARKLKKSRPVAS